MIPVSRSGGVKPKVIVTMTSYNYGKYISDAIDSVLAQKTDFPFELHVSDDASTDGTHKILKKYARRYPDKVKILLCAENKGIAINRYRLLNGLDSEYFAPLDADDLFVGDQRLQKQVDFLDSHKEYAICSGFTQLIVDGKPGRMILPPEFSGITYTFADYFRRPALFHLSGLMFRNVIYKYGVPRSYHTHEIVTGDNVEEDFQRMVHLEKGPLYVLPELVSYYRIKPDSDWNSRSEMQQALTAVRGYTKFVLYYYGRYPELKESIRGYVKPWYQKMWQLLINEHHIFPEWKLSRKDTEVLTEAMLDMVTINEADHWLGERVD